MSNKNFFEKVYQAAKQIPEGKVSTYGAIAKFIGSQGAARMVGWAMNKCNSHEEFVPAHRVVNRIGLLTGKNHFGNQNTMKELLESEGVEIKNNKIINFKEAFWNEFE